MTKLLEVGICLDDIPQDRIKTARNGKKYVNFYLSERMSVGSYGETHSAYVLQGEIGQPATKCYIGSAKPHEKKGE